MKWAVFLSLMVSLVGGGVAQGQVTPGWSFGAVNFPGARFTDVNGISNRVAVRSDLVGSFGDDEGEGLFARWRFRFIELPTPDPCRSAVSTSGVNIHRTIVGSFCNPHTDPSGAVHYGYAMVLGTRNRPQEVELIHPPGSQYTWVTAINDQRDVVGTYLTADGVSHAFLLQEDTYVDLPPLDGWEVYPMSINNHGHIAGTLFRSEPYENQGFVFKNGAYELFTLPYSTIFGVTGINDHGMLVGWFWEAGGEHEHCCHRGWVKKGRTFAPLDIAPDAETVPWGVNNLGNVAGTYYRPQDGWLSHGFVVTPKRQPPPKHVSQR